MRWKKFTIAVSLLILGVSGHLDAQNPYNFMLLPEMVGFSPSVTRRPYYPAGAVDINVFPLTWMYGNTRRMHSRNALILNLGIREGEAIAIDNFGVSSFIPIYIKPRELQSEVASGVYIAPGVEMIFSREPFAVNYDVKLLLESGYSFPVENMTISAGLQGGLLYHSDNSDPTLMMKTIYLHFGVNVTVGFWHLF
ncbi:MAG: hypothetical protein R6V49_03350 [Bacteroidales bacterium]